MPWSLRTPNFTILVSSILHRSSAVLFLSTWGPHRFVISGEDIDDRDAMSRILSTKRLAAPMDEDHKTLHVNGVKHLRSLGS